MLWKVDMWPWLGWMSLVVGQAVLGEFWVKFAGLGRKSAVGSCAVDCFHPLNA